MATVYTKIAKASGTVYTKVVGGYQFYDSSTLYDASTATYDGFYDQTVYTNIAKASGTVYTKVAKAL